jgi:hypothetical protein
MKRTFEKQVFKNCIPDKNEAFYNKPIVIVTLLAAFRT